MLELIYEKATEINEDVKFYYLCSDLHLYQTGTVTMETDRSEKMVIEQYIVGTGGTELDPAYHSKTEAPDFEPPRIDMKYPDKVTYIMKTDIAQCGFLAVNLKEGALPEFVPHLIEQQEVVKTGGTVRRPRRQKFSRVLRKQKSRKLQKGGKKYSFKNKKSNKNKSKKYF